MGGTTPDPDDDVPDAGTAVKTSAESVDHDPQNETEGQKVPKQKEKRSGISTAKVMTSISFLFLLSAAVYRYISRK